jgi:hydrogenase maturation protein HypF
MQKRARIYVKGLVQGVGFRPFIYTIATEHNLKGYVLNLGDAGVEIVVEGEESAILSFIQDIRGKKPSVARIDDIEVFWEKAIGEFKEFSISKSDVRKLSVNSVIPTDLGICDLCITDIYKNGRWHHYPFTACAQCGPRFTILYNLPYDRENTSMSDFPLCTYCQAEYENPLDRRYDAQGTTCSICGPRLYLVDREGNYLEGDPLQTAAKLLVEGNIIAVKGIGGFHIAVDATNQESVEELRKRRKRPSQPFAVMSRSVEKIKKYAEVSALEEELLKSHYKPIVVLQKAPSYNLAESVSPGLDSIGVMLPYTGIHLLLLDFFGKDALVMTSGNYPGRPIAIDNAQALKELKNIVDFYLMHNRKIVNRCDDSVIKIVDGAPLFLRKSRGYAPSYLTVPWNISSKTIISVGGEFNVTGSIFFYNKVITTQHIGDINDLDTLDYLKNALSFILKIYEINSISKVAHDLNPGFLTSRYAREISENYGASITPVQHHHAHMAALMAEHSLATGSNIVCITIDGVGYGTDGNAWGGEILLGGYSNFARVAHLRYQPMPGGDLCAYYPARFLASTLSTVMNESEIFQLFEKKYIKYLRFGSHELSAILKQSKNENIIFSSSMGRLLDAIAVLLDVCAYRTYEGEPPIRLEAFAKQGKPSNINLRLPIKKDSDKYIIDTSEFILSIIENIKDNRAQDLAYEIHKVLGETLGETACQICDEYGISLIGLSGGSAVNNLLVKYIKQSIYKNNKKLIQHKFQPPGDGCVSVGQAVVASQCD